MIVSTTSCVGNGMGTPGAGVAQAVGRPRRRAERSAVAGPAQTYRLRLVRLIGHGSDTSFGTPMGAAVATLALAARIVAHLGGTDTSGTRKGKDAQAFVEAGEVTFDAADEKADLLAKMPISRPSCHICNPGARLACAHPTGTSHAWRRPAARRRRQCPLRCNERTRLAPQGAAQQSMWRLQRRSKWYALVHLARNEQRTSLPHCCTANGPHRGRKRGGRAGRRRHLPQQPVVDLKAKRVCHDKISPAAPRTLPAQLCFGGEPDGCHGPAPEWHWHAPRVTKTYGGGARLWCEAGRFPRQRTGGPPPARRIGPSFFAERGRSP